MKTMTKLQKSLIILSVFFILVSFFFVYKTNEKEKILLQQQEALYQKELALEQQTKASLDSLELLAKAVSVYDLTSNKKIYGKNDDMIMPWASLVKTMTIIVALENNQNKEIIISKNTESGAQGDFLKKDEIWDLSDLAKFTLVLSSNGGAEALAQTDSYFLNKMNQKALQMGLLNTKFLNVTGLDLQENQAGAYGTASEANQLAIYAFKKYPEIFGDTVLKNMSLESKSNFVHNIENTNLIIDKIPNILFSKTGFTNLAGGNLTIIFTNANRHDIAISVLGSTMTGRFVDMEKIINTLYNLEYDI